MSGRHTLTPRILCGRLGQGSIVGTLTRFLHAQILQHVALFDKCKNFTKAREVQAAGLYPYFKPISESEDTVVVIEGHKKVMMGSNNYLGLPHHPKVLEAAKAALERYGSGCTRRRVLAATPY